MTPYINLAFAFVTIMTAVYAAFEDRPWICFASCGAAGLNISQFVLHQQPG